MRHRKFDVVGGGGEVKKKKKEKERMRTRNDDRAGGSSLEDAGDESSKIDTLLPISMTAKNSRVAKHANFTWYYQLYSETS